MITKILGALNELFGLYTKGLTYSMVVGVATNNCLRCQTAPVAEGIETSPRYINWGRREEITMYC